ncbi:hypothetical protein chiPu_0017220 [Chiloscyllium punctatum]|uniref:Uncharacterized protein n=1 Tax=Chiloscyllium punctatum TaxID=137246 RepID=A0A401T7W2_CHIPU|nr:hypothetical protein [Chiloscyllium punctatum]
MRPRLARSLSDSGGRVPGCTWSEGRGLGASGVKVVVPELTVSHGQIRLQFRICHKQEESLIVLRIFVVHKLELVKIIKLHTKVLKGQISYHFRYPKAKHIVNLLFYYDEVTQWPSVYKNSSKDCWSKEAVAANGNSQLLNLTQSFLLSGCQLVETNGINYTDCQRRLNVHSARERWWFLAISNCKGGGITMEYTITMSNGKTLWRRHFSANQIGHLKKRRLLHSSFLMLMASVGAEVLGHFFLSIHLGIYALNGVGCQSVKIIGRLLLVISYLLLVPMLLLISHGFTITRFFAVPISSLFGQFMIVNWKRERIMNTVSLFLKFYVYIVMLFLTRPFQSNLRFPYHIDTSRIALMRYASESQENLEQLGHHIYRNISMTSFINDSSTAPNVPNSSGANIWGLQEDTDFTRGLLERTQSPIDSRFGFVKKQETNQWI